MKLNYIMRPEQLLEFTQIIGKTVALSESVLPHLTVVAQEPMYKIAIDQILTVLIYTAPISFLLIMNIISQVHSTVFEDTTVE